MFILLFCIFFLDVTLCYCSFLPKAPQEYMMQQGGVSKATKTLNLSEDIFAGMDFLLRGGGVFISHRIHGAGIYGIMDPINRPPLC